MSADMEAALAEIWATVLGIERVGLDDNFFELGGDSLAAVRAVARARVLLQRAPPLQLLFTSPTIRAVAAGIEALPRAGREWFERLERVTADHHLPVTVNQEKRLLMDACLADAGHSVPSFNLALCLRIDGPLNLDAMEGAVNGLIERHDGLRARFAPASTVAPTQRRSEMRALVETGIFATGLFHQTIMPRATVTLRTISVAHLTGADQLAAVETLVDREVTMRIDYDAPPLLRALIIALGDDRQVLLLVLPHLVSDERSLEVLHHELVQLYQAASVGETAPLNERPLQGADFASWQQRYLNSDAAASAIQHWTQQWSQFGRARLTTDDLAPLIVPAQVPPGTSPSRVHISIDTPTSTALRACARELHVTLYVQLLSSLFLTLHIETGKPQLAIWANFANRERPEFDDVVGWFVNSHLLAATLDSESDVESFIRQVQETVLNATTHQGVPTLSLWRAVGSMPTVQDELPVSLDFRRWDAGFSLSCQTPATTPGLVEIPLPRRRPKASRGLSAMGVDTKETIELMVGYHPRRVPEAAARRLLSRWAAVTCRLPDARLARVPDVARRT
jgi:acyl carrier protein